MTSTDRFVIDTNTLISALLIKGSTTFRAMEKARNKGFLIFSDETFLEFEMVLLRKKFDRYFSEEERLELIENIRLEGIFIPVVSNNKDCRDAKDDKFLNLAIDSEASCIITGDADLLVLNPYQNVSILTPSDFLIRD